MRYTHIYDTHRSHWHLPKETKEQLNVYTPIMYIICIYICFSDSIESSTNRRKKTSIKYVNGNAQRQTARLGIFVD